MLTLLKVELETLYKVLQGTQGVLSLSESRIRDSIMKDLSELIETYGKEKLAIFDKFCDKDENGVSKVEPKEDGTSTYYFTKFEQKSGFNDEMKVLNTESVELKASTQLKDIIEKTIYKPQYGEVEIIDAILAKI